MKKTQIFISHSWHDKFEARQLITLMRTLPFMDVWVDSEQLQPGALIQSEIDDKLKSVDLVLLLWSKSAIASLGVQAEIATCEQLQKRLIICKLDATDLDSDYLKAMKSIQFTPDFNAGAMRLVGSLFNSAPPEWLDLLPKAILEQWNQYGGLYEETNHFAFGRKPEPEKRNLVADTYQQQLNEQKSEIEQQLSEMKSVEVYFAAIMPRIEANLMRPDVLQAILTEVQQSVYAQTAVGKMLIAQLEQIVRG
jgi:TIR domain